MNIGRAVTTLTLTRQSSSLIQRLGSERRLSGEGASAMGQSDALQQATERLDAAADQLETFLRGVFADAEGGVSIAELRDQVRFLTEERDRLLPISTPREIACAA